MGAYSGVANSHEMDDDGSEYLFVLFPCEGQLWQQLQH